MHQSTATNRWCNRARGPARAAFAAVLVVLCATGCAASPVSEPGAAGVTAPAASTLASPAPTGSHPTHSGLQRLNEHRSVLRQLRAAAESRSADLNATDGDTAVLFTAKQLALRLDCQPVGDEGPQEVDDRSLFATAFTCGGPSALNRNAANTIIRSYAEPGEQQIDVEDVVGYFGGHTPFDALNTPAVVAGPGWMIVTHIRAVAAKAIDLGGAKLN